MSNKDHATVLVVEDDDAVRDAVQRGLQLNGFLVNAAASAESALASFARQAPDILIVDVGLPKMSGIELCTELRARHVDLPVLILSARDAVGDRVDGLKAGADDYLVKPFDLDELVLRLRALLRRSVPVVDNDVVSAGDIWIDFERRSARCLTTVLDLSRREFDLLGTLVRNHGVVMNRYRLLELVWGYDFDVDTNVVDVFVGYLRRKLEACGSPDSIRTIRGIGFMFEVNGAVR